MKQQKKAEQLKFRGKRRNEEEKKYEMKDSEKKHLACTFFIFSFGMCRNINIETGKSVAERDDEERKMKWNSLTSMKALAMSFLVSLHIRPPKASVGSSTLVAELCVLFERATEQVVERREAV